MSEWKELDLSGLTEEEAQAEIARITEQVQHALLQPVATLYKPTGVLRKTVEYGPSRLTEAQKYILAELEAIRLLDAKLLITGRWTRKHSPLPYPKPQPPLLFVEPYSCSSCDGDYHADWTCPICGHKNLMGLWEVEAPHFCTPADEVTDTCENKACGITVRLHAMYDEEGELGNVDNNPSSE